MLKRPALFLLFLLAIALPAAAQFPRINSFSPRRGGPGTVVVILGSNLGGVTDVRIGLGSATLLERTTTGLAVIVGPDATIGPISVFSAVGQDVTFDNFQVAPRVSGFERVLPVPQTPDDRFRGVPGNQVAIYGANFSDSSDPNFRVGALFAGVPAVVDVAASTNLIVTIPFGAASGPITVTNNAGSAVSLGDFYLQPVVTRFAPAAVQVGDVLTLTGVSLKGVSSVLFGTVPAVPSVVTPTNVVVTVPAITNSVRLAVTSPGGTYLTLSNLVLLPRIDGFTPVGGAPGTLVTLSGSGLAGALGVEIGGVRAGQFTNVGPSSVNVVVPAAANTGAIRLWTGSGTNTTVAAFLVAPTLSSYTPVRGLPGSTVTLNGRNFTGATQVTFNGVAAAFTVVDNTRVQAVVPAGATTGPIRITHPGGSAAGPVFQVGGSEPVVSGFTPAGGPAGTQVQVNGINFTGATLVRFGGVAANELIVVDDTSILTRVPAGAATGPLTVVSPDGTGVSGTSFVVGSEADLRVTISTAGPDPGLGQPVVVEVSVENRGPLPAAGLRATINADIGLTLVSASVTQGTWEVIGQTVTAQFGTLAPGATARATVTVQADAWGSLALSALAVSDVPDGTPADNEAVRTFDVGAPVLGIVGVPGGQVRLTWPTVPDGLVVETTLNPYTGLWVPVAGTPEQAGTSWELRVPASDAARYFRLRQGP